MANIEYSQPRPFWWAVCVFLLSIAYLFPEAVFNAELVAVAGGLDSSDDELRSIELFGRAISGVGVTLLLADLLIKGPILHSKFRTFLIFILLAVLAWPTVFFGQKWLVDQYIVNTSTPQERQQAYYSQVVRSALIRNAVEIEGVPYNPDQVHSAAEMTFLALFGGMVYADEQLMAKIEQHKEPIIKEYVRKSAYQDFDQHYARYNSMRSQLEVLYKDYAQGSKDYNQSLSSIPMRTSEYRRQVEAEIREGWISYQDAEKALQRQAEVKAKQIAPKIYDYFQHKNNCSSNTCLQRLDNAYKKQIRQAGLAGTPSSYWLITETREIGLLAKAISGVMTLGLSVVADVMDGDNDTITTQYYTNDVSHYQKLLVPKMESSFVKRSGGYATGVKDLSEFRNLALTSERIRASLQEKGLNLPVNWRIAHQSKFNQAVAAKITAETEQRWQSSMSKHGLTMGPNKSWALFQKDAQVQQRINKKMGDEYYINPMLMDWNNRQFKQRVVDPNVSRETQRLMRELNAQLPAFADGGELEKKAKSALRATVVPPISMSLSLFLVILTALKLPVKAIQLWRIRKAASAMAPTSVDGVKKKLMNTSVNGIVSLVLLLLILGLPLSVVKNRYTEQDSAVHYFLDQIKGSTSPIIGYVLNWVINVQPLIQPIGSALEQSLGLVASFERNQVLFDQLDEQVLGHAVSTSSAPAVVAVELSATAVAVDMVSLMISVNVADADIRIMNIAPRYHPSIKLAAGQYDIAVSAPGYQPQRRWVTLDAQNTNFSFVLDRL